MLSLSDRVLDGLVRDVRHAAFGHTYLETVGSHADSWHDALQFSSSMDWCEAFTREVARRLPRAARKRAWLLVDVTEEPFYAEPTLDTVPSDGEHGVTAVWKFLVAALFDPRTRRTIPLAAGPMPLGRGLADALDELLTRVRAQGITPGLVLADREFYQGAVIETFEARQLRYLLLVPKNSLVGPMAAQCRATGRWAVVKHEIEWWADRSTHHVTTHIALWPDEQWDWSFATNLPASQVHGLAARYRLRWNIETLFRVHDEARIKTKSRRAIVRLATFLVSLFVTALWELLRARPVFKRWLLHLERVPFTGVLPARLPRPDG
jgi:IS4 transposase